MRLRALWRKSTLLSFSDRESNPNGKMNRIKKEAGLSSRFPRLNQTRRKFMKTSPSSLLVAPFSKAKKSMDLDSSHLRFPLQSAIVSRYGSISMNQILNPSLTIKPFLLNSSRTWILRWGRSTLSRWRIKEPRSSPREKERRRRQRRNDYICRYWSPITTDLSFSNNYT